MATYHLRVKNDTNPGGTKVSAKRHADYILRDDGKAHADYINREGAQREKTDCVFKGSQLPKWAKGSAQKFFSAATRYEDKRNRRYKEIELSLPNELTLEQNREIVERFIANHVANHYYAYAIHEKAGELSGERHPHVHIMFSERLIDDVEEAKERPAYKYFRRAARPLKGEQVASFERRREHGAPKAPKWHDKKYLCEMRADFARIQNEVLAKYGYSIRVDHRTLEVQQAVAEQNGDTFLAQVRKRTPESYIGIISTHEENNLVLGVKRCRQNIHQKQHALFLDDLKRKSVEEGETKLLVKKAEGSWLAISSSQAYKSVNLGDESLRDLNQRILSGLAKIQRLKREMVGYSCAKEQAQKEYLSATDHQFIRDYESKVSQREDLERFFTELVSTSTYLYPENQKAFQTIKSGIEKRISDLRSFLAQNNPKYWAILGKLDEPYRRKNVELVVHGLLQNDLKILAELKQTSSAVLKNIDALKELIKEREKPKTMFTASEIRENLLRQYRSLKKQYEKAVDNRNALMLSLVSPINALNRAKNIFVHGGFDKLHAKLEEYEKTLEQFGHDKSQYLLWQQTFNDQKWTSAGDKLREQYYLTKKKIRLEMTGRKLAETKNQLDSELTHLEKLCQTEEAKEKIAFIAAGILFKNLEKEKEYEKAKKVVSDLSTKLQEVEKRFKAFDEGYRSLNQNRMYRVIQPESNSLKTSALKENELAKIIADALLGEEYAVQLVAHSTGNNLEMEKDWEMMSEFDKDEIIRKKIIREL
jgi:hypothetical protein